MPFGEIIGVVNTGEAQPFPVYHRVDESRHSNNQAVIGTPVYVLDSDTIVITPIVIGTGAFSLSLEANLERPVIQGNGEIGYANAWHPLTTIAVSSTDNITDKKVSFTIPESGYTAIRATVERTSGTATRFRVYWRGYPLR